MKAHMKLVWLVFMTATTAAAQTYSGTSYTVNGTSSVGQGIFASGNGDAANFSTVDNEIDSWFGLGIKSQCCSSYNGYGIVFDARSGSMFTQGHIGVGTSNPNVPLDVVGSVRSSISGGNNSFIAVGNSPSTNVTSGTNTGLYLQNQSVTPGNHSLIQGFDANGHIQGSLGFLYGDHTGSFQASIFIEPRLVSSPSAFVVASNGNVGIGTGSPSTPLEVNGNIRLSAGPGSSIIFSDGSVQSHAWDGVLESADYAESIDVTGERSSFEPGDLLVIDPAQEGRFQKATKPYSTLISGVYSTKPGALGRQKPRSVPRDQEVPMAMVGIVPTKVSTENGPVHAGDLLVSSSTPGYAMKGTNRKKLTGAVLGKAMGSIESGKGVIQALISLQ